MAPSTSQLPQLPLPSFPAQPGFPLGWKKSWSCFYAGGLTWQPFCPPGEFEFQLDGLFVGRSLALVEFQAAMTFWRLRPLQNSEKRNNSCAF